MPKELFRADFSRSLELGVGLRFEHIPSGRWIDLRLEGHPKRAPRLSGRLAEFRLPEGMVVRYHTEPNRVKEIITLARPEPAALRFKLLAPGLVPRERAGEIVLSSPRTPSLFKLAPVEAYDARGRAIPAVLVLEDGDVVIRLDEQALATAAVPITIDPTIEGVPAGATEGPHARLLFRTSDGRLVFFYFARLPNWDDQLAYRVSSDDGQTWAPEVLVGDQGTLVQLSVTQTPNDTFYATYEVYHPSNDGREVVVRAFTPSGGGWQAGPQRTVVSDAGESLPEATVVELGQGPLGRRLAVGFNRQDRLLHRRDYVVSFSENGGEVWGPPTVCRAGVGSEFFMGTIARQADRLHCITAKWGVGLSWSEWTGVAWTPAAPMVVGRYAVYPPSTTVTDDGTLHLVTEEGEQAYTGTNDISHTSLPPTAGAWSLKTSIGQGDAPVISTTGTSLFVYAEEEVSHKERWIRPYVATDGKTWHPGTPIGGRPFDYVLDRNTTWDIQPRTRDMLFALRDGSGSDFGNRVGIAVVPHRLDAPTESVSFSFVAPTPDTGSDPYPDVVLSDAPWGYWRLGETSGTTATDSSGNGGDGSYTGGVTLGVDGTTPDGDKAASFDGANDHVAPSALLNTGVVTVEAWIKISGAPSTSRNIVSFQNGLGSDVTDKRLILGSDGKIRFHVWDGANRYAVSNVSVPTGAWTHVAAVADGTTAKVYQNGVEVASVSAGQSYAAYTVPNMFVAAGGPHADGTMGYFPGSIDEVAVYDSALSASRIQAHRDAGVSAQGQVRRIELWVGSNNAPTYRIGLQSDVGGVPSGHWLDEVRVGDLVLSGAYTDRALGTSSSEWSTVFQIPDTTLAAGDRYHVVVQPNPTPLESPPSATRWAAVDAVETDPGAEGDFRVLDGVGVNWTVAAAQVPLFRLETPDGDAVVQQGIRPEGSQLATEYTVPGETFVAPADLAPTEARVYLRKVGDPTGTVTLRLLGVENDEVWSGSGVPQDTGWFRVPVTGLALGGGQRYRLLVDGPNRDLENYWEAPTTGTFWDDSSSWEGTEATLVIAPDRPGYNDRSVEASDGLYPTWDRTTLFNSNAADELYLGDAHPFDFAVLVRGWNDKSKTVPTEWSYWSGAAWVPLSTEGEFGDPWEDETRFTPPLDWQPTSVDGRTAYWIRGRPSAAPQPIIAHRITSIRKLGWPTVVARGASTIPLAWSEFGEQPGVDFAPYDAVPPSLSSPAPAVERNTLERRPDVSVSATDADSGVNASGIGLELDGEPVSATYEGSADVGVIRHRPGADLAPGLHTARVIALDSAGNLSEETWRFNVATALVTAGSVEASSDTVAFQPGTTQVEFTTVPTEISDSILQLSSSNAIGSGSAAIVVPLDQAVTVFSEGASSTNVAVGLNAQTLEREYVILGPSEVEIDAELRGGNLDVGPVRVNVPAAFQSSGGEARLVLDAMLTVSLSFPDPNPFPVNCSDSEQCEIEGLVECIADSGPAEGCNAPRVELFLRRPDGRREAIVGPRPPLVEGIANTERAPQQDPISPEPNGCNNDSVPGLSCKNLLGNPSPPYHRTHARVGFGEMELFAVYGHHRYYSIEGPNRTPLVASWQQSEARPGSIPCFPGSTQRATASLLRIANTVESTNDTWTLGPNTQLIDWSYQQGDRVPDQNPYVELRREETLSGSPTWIYEVGNEIELTAVTTPSGSEYGVLGEFEPALGRTYRNVQDGVAAPDIEEMAANAGVWNRWTPNSTERSDYAEIMTGAEFEGGDLSSYQFRVGAYFAFAYDSSSCF